jgi:hypothetical protein
MKPRRNHPRRSIFGWTATRRGEQYRPHKKVEGADADLIGLKLAPETQLLLESLPPNATVHFQLAAHNSDKSHGVTQSLS